MKQQTHILKTSDGLNLFTQHWRPDSHAKGTIVIAHGYGEHSGRYRHVAEYFVQQGYAVYTLDHRGHGQSRGELLGYFERFEAVCDDLRRYIEWVRTEDKAAPLFLLGHSMGGLVSLYYAVNHQAMLKGLILSGTLLPVSSTISVANRIMLRILSQINPRSGVMPVDSNTVSKDRAVVEAYDSDPDVYHGKIPARVGAEWIAAADYVSANLPRITVPILILHGSADRLISPTNSQTIYDHVGSTDKALKFYEGLYHEIVNEPEKARVLADIWVWLASHHGTAELRNAAIEKRR
jgi:acylglycerol lipase